MNTTLNIATVSLFSQVLLVPQLCEADALKVGSLFIISSDDVVGMF